MLSIVVFNSSRKDRQARLAEKRRETVLGTELDIRYIKIASTPVRLFATIAGKKFVISLLLYLFFLFSCPYFNGFVSYKLE